MTTVNSTQRLNAAIMSVWTLSSGRGLVRYRAPRTAANPSGIQVAHTALLSTPEGQSAGRELRRRERPAPLSLIRTTPVEITSEVLPDGSLLRIITPINSEDTRKVSTRTGR